MKPIVALSINLALAAALGCANVAGIADLKKEGEGGAALGAACTNPGDCGAGLTCGGGTCLRNCFDLSNPAKTCIDDACYPFDNTSAVCFAAGAGTSGPCTELTDCAARYGCAEIRAGAGRECVPWCHEGGTECDGGTVCIFSTDPIIIDKVQWGVCGPATSTTGTTSLRSTFATPLMLRAGPRE